MAKKLINLKDYARSFHAAPVRRIELAVPHAPKPRRVTYVYYCGDGKGKVKIGFSANPWSRCKEGKCFNPDAKILAVERGTSQTERERHKQFAKDHLVLEWFRLSPELQGHIDSLAVDT